MNVAETLLVFFLAWQVSSMPIPAWIAAAFFGIDGYAFNSTKQFTENHFALENRFWPTLTFILEFVKGLAAMSLMVYLPTHVTLLYIDLTFWLSVVILLGHTFPIYSEFAPSKSLGTYLGVLSALAFFPGVMAVLVFFITWLMLKKVSIITYLLAVFTFVCLTFTNYDVQLLLLTVALSSLVLVFVSTRSALVSNI
jgi:glycerol-3-phosphate acyltransferase PlsY